MNLVEACTIGAPEKARNRKKCSRLLLPVAMTAALLVSATAHANTYFVAPTGSDAQSGAQATPWRTLRYAVSQLQAGDTLYLRGGTYTGATNTINSALGAVPSGTSWNNAVTIAGYPGETVTIHPPDGLAAVSLTTSAPHYLIFQDFIIDMSSQTMGPHAGGPDGVYVSSGAHHNRFQRLEVKNNTVNGFAFSNNGGNSPYNEVLNCLIHDNGRFVAADDPYNNGYGAYVFTSDNLFDGNDIYNNGGYGLHFFNNSGPKDVSRNVIRNNRIHDNGTRGGSNYAIAIAWGDGNLIYNNLIYRNNGGVLAYVGSTNTRIYNNTFYANRDEGVLPQYSASVTIKNNLFFRNGTAILDLNSDTVISNNLTTDPAFVNPGAADFRLRSGSAAIDGGSTLREVTRDFTGAARPSGGAYDIGAFEFGVAGVPRPPSNVRIVTQ
jgi:parallel beta-helix repeat protein